ncbi:MAG: mevalonate kinase [Thiomicrorhabdus sp.]|nr:MAG: mevalonate kinase [Thiomicrorhabdus sp.]
MKTLTELKQWQSYAPANTMILGEHSVVYGYPALACALDQFIQINWQQRRDSEIHIQSALANHQTTLNELASHPKLAFVMQTLKVFQSQLPFGLNIEIKSDFSSTIGLGSSAAVLAAMLSGLNSITEQKLSILELFELGHSIILKIQGRGSGTDLAASLAGGVIYFKPKFDLQPSPVIENLSLSFPLSLIYAGYKTPTSQVLALVAEQWQAQPKQLAQIYQAMGKTTEHAYSVLQRFSHEAESKPENSPGNQAASATLTEFYASFNHYQDLMDQLGVNDETLKKLIDNLTQCQNIHAAKISGSGLGDCVIAIGKQDHCPTSVTQVLQNYQQIQVNISKLGASTKIIKPNNESHQHG